MKSFLIGLAVVGMALSVVSVAAPASANTQGWNCEIIFVGGFVDQTCDSTGQQFDGVTCWAIGWWC